MTDRIDDVLVATGKRHTVRKFADAPVPEEDLVRILSAARNARADGEGSRVSEYDIGGA